MSYLDDHRYFLQQESFRNTMEERRVLRLAPSWNTGAENKVPDRQEWIIQRCTQRWIGTELQYEDWPTTYGAKAKTRSEMLGALKRLETAYPDDEFRGHNVANCKCPNHANFRETEGSGPCPLPEGHETEKTS
jgi:hypothetical protein